MFDAALLEQATGLIGTLRAGGLHLATAESCTGGLIAALLTEISGASDVVDCGLVTYSNAAKVDLLGVPGDLLERHGAVSREVALAMAEGALTRAHSGAGGAIAVAVTGIAGPGGGSAEKPVGLVHLAVAHTGFPTRHLECRFGDVGRQQVRLQTVDAALGLIASAVSSSANL